MQMYKLGSMLRSKDHRRSHRKSIGASGWIRMDGGFAVRQCNVLDLSDTGVRIAVDAPQTIPGTFTFLKSRDASSGRRARVKWRRGSQIGAEFL
jgi:hypothetical protein